MAGRPDPEQVKHALIHMLGELVEQLLPGGRYEGAEYRAEGPDGAKWGVVMRGGKIGRWQNFGAGVGGHSPLSLIRDALCAGDHIAAYAWAVRWLGGESLPPIEPPPRRHEAPTPSMAKNTGIGLYLKAKPFDWENPVGQYLRYRDIDPAWFGGHPIRALRYHPELWCDEVQRHLPAMLAPIIHPATHQHIATHRTYLALRDGRWRKAQLQKPKKILGSFAGGLIPLHRGPTGRPFAKAQPGEKLMLSEGIENALTMVWLEPTFRVAAYIAAGNLRHLILPGAFGEIGLCHDRDGENWSVRELREVAREQWRIENREVHDWKPPEGVKDANDYWSLVVAGRIAA